LIEFFVKNGAPGVIVFGCPPRDCASREGPKWLHERVFNDREAELQPRVDRRRVCLATSAPGDLDGLIAEFDAFAKHLAVLDPPERVADPAFEAVCDSVLSDQAAP
jgi:coenzyme F420-reducing hydrogenase delta subunit